MIGGIGIETAGRSERRIGDHETQSGAGEGENGNDAGFLRFVKIIFRNTMLTEKLQIFRFSENIFRILLAERLLDCGVFEIFFAVAGRTSGYISGGTYGSTYL